ncbi:MAG: triose-phosphate isomerase [Endomicrobium sp.]|jgi:triosephosphate isomerase|nr:triose-phosphate isomerase [Endomicrobium sp.]
MRRPLIVGNWKMNKTIQEAIQTINDLKTLVTDIANINNIDIVICPAYTALYAVKHAIAHSRLMLGAQNIFWQENGAFTGEISTSMIKDLGCSYVIVGHSERRQYFKETDSDINKKILVSLNKNITPILCIGESLQNRVDKLTFNIIKTQLEHALANVKSNQITSVIIAYEPIWAIGTGQTATPFQAQEVHLFIRKFCEDKYGYNIADKMRIIYGGSVNSENISDLMKETDIDGGLIGGASLQAKSFTQLIKNLK